MTEWGIPEMTEHMTALLEKSEVVRGKLSKFFSFDDDARALEDSDSLMGHLCFLLMQLEDSMDSIQYRVELLNSE